MLRVIVAVVTCQVSACGRRTWLVLFIGEQYVGEQREQGSEDCKANKDGKPRHLGGVHTATRVTTTVTIIHVAFALLLTPAL